MSVRRLSRPPIVVLTGVENSGKSTLAESLSAALGWALLPEAARHDDAVLSGQFTVDDLSRLLAEFQRDVATVSAAHPPGVLCDTGGVVLDLWSEVAFHQPLPGAADLQAEADLYVLCRTLPEWEPDPLRSLPDLAARRDLEARYVNRLNERGLPWVDLPALPLDQRVQRAKDAILHALS